MPPTAPPATAATVIRSISKQLNIRQRHAPGKSDVVAVVVVSFKRVKGHSGKHAVGAFAESKQPTTLPIEHHLQTADVVHALHDVSESQLARIVAVIAVASELLVLLAVVDNAIDAVEKLAVVSLSIVEARRLRAFQYQGEILFYSIELCVYACFFLLSFSFRVYR